MPAGINRAPAKEAPHYASNYVGGAKFTVGASASHIVNVAVQLCDANFNAQKVLGVVDVYISDNSDGHTLTAATLDALGIGTNGVLLATLTSLKALKILANASGQFDLNVQKNAGGTYYLVVVMWDGTILVSPAIVIT